MHIFIKFKVLLLSTLIFLVLGFTKTALADDIILNDLNGQAVNFSTPINKPTIIFFWTTWCPYCRREIKDLNQLYPQMKKEGIVLFVVSIGEPDYKVKRFFKDYVPTFNVFLDATAQLANLYDVVGVPTYVLLNKFGKQVAHVNALPVDYANLLLK